MSKNLHCIAFPYCARTNQGDYDCISNGAVKRKSVNNGDVMSPVGLTNYFFSSKNQFLNLNL